MHHQDHMILPRALRGVSFKAAAGMALFASALLAGCGGGGGDDGSSSNPPPVTRSLGLMEITINGIGSGQITSHAALPGGTGAPQAHVAQPTPVTQGLDVKQVSSSYVDVGSPGSGTRYITVVYAVRNASFCSTPGSCAANAAPTGNLTLIAANTASNINATALTGISLFDGTSSTATRALATSLLPTHGMQMNGTAGSGVIVQPGLESLQVFSEDEVAAIPRDTGATDLFPYGYVVSNPSTPNSRSLPGSPGTDQFDGRVSFSFSVPLQSDRKNDPYSVTLIFQVVDDANTRVTESLEEDNPAGDVAANLRAALLGAADLVTLGGHVAQTSIGNPQCNVRVAGSSASPTAYLVNHGSAAALGAAPYNLQNRSTTNTVNAGFCVQMAAPTAANFVVYGSMTGKHSGTYSGGGSNRLVFTPDPAHPFQIGETVSFSLTGGLAANDGLSSLATPFVGGFAVNGTQTSVGPFLSYYSSVPVGAGNPTALAGADFTGDGRRDLLLADSSTSMLDMLVNNGHGFDVYPVWPGPGIVPKAIAVGDFTGLGHNDLAVVGSNQVNILFSGGFTSFNYAGSVPVGNDPVAVVTGDFNRDGLLDLAVANSTDDTVSILLNNGGGAFTVSTVTVGSLPASLAVGDFNRDGKLDIAVGNFSSQSISILTGDGAGGFTVSAVGLSASPTSIVAGDLNGDGKTDLAAATNVGVVSILLGDGNGGFSYNPISNNVYVGGNLRKLAIGNFKGYGKPDLAVSNSTNYSVSVLLGDGSGGFAVSTIAGLTAPGGLDVGDYDGDNKSDIAVTNGNNGNVAVLLNNGSGSFGTGITTVGSKPIAVAAADFNGDGKPDAVVANYYDNTVTLLTNAGRFASPILAATAVVNVGNGPQSIAIGDFNGDGKPDFATANFSGNSVSVVLNNGSGGFTTSTVAAGANPSYLVAADFNGDGLQDLAVANSGDGTVSILLNDGSGGFNASIVTVGSTPAGLALADFNGDGKLDLAIANAGDATISILLGDGHGGFSATAMPVGGSPISIASGDFNGDGRPDLAVGTLNAAAVSILLNDGKGGFITSTVNVGHTQSAIAVGDLNGDGNTDLVVASVGDNTVSSLIGDGHGGFTVSTVPVGNNPYSLALANFYDDQMLSLVTANGGDNMVQLVLKGY